MKKISLIVLIFSIGASRAVYAQDNAGFAFLKIDVDARAAAMAGSYTALANDASAAYWNPAGLALAGEQSILVMHNDWLLDISHSFAAYQFISGKHNFAFSINYIQIPGIEITLQAAEEKAGTIDAYNLSSALSYATMYDDHWAIGVTLKYLFEKYYLVSAPGWAVDLGVQRKDVFEFTDLGFSIQNLGKMSKLDNSATLLPIIIASDLSFSGHKFFEEKLIFSVGLRWIEKEKTYLHTGMEYQISDNFFARGGVRNGNENTIWTGGFGIKYKNFYFDYAYVPFEYNLGVSNRLSLRLKF